MTPPVTAPAPAQISDVVFSHHHPDHTLNAALFPGALHAGRRRVLAVASPIVPGHGAPFAPTPTTPR